MKSITSFCLRVTAMRRSIAKERRTRERFLQLFFLWGSLVGNTADEQARAQHPALSVAAVPRRWAEAGQAESSHDCWRANGLSAAWGGRSLSGLRCRRWADRLRTHRGTVVGGRSSSSCGHRFRLAVSGDASQFFLLSFGAQFSPYFHGNALELANQHRIKLSPRPLGNFQYCFRKALCRAVGAVVGDGV